MPDHRHTALERAFALADSGMLMTEVRKQLKQEGYDQSQLNGPTLVRQLNQRSRKSRESQPPAGSPGTS